MGTSSITPINFISFLFNLQHLNLAASSNIKPIAVIDWQISVPAFGLPKH